MSMTRKEYYNRVKLLAELLGFRYSQDRSGFDVTVYGELGTGSAYVLRTRKCDLMMDYSITYKLDMAKVPITIRDIDKRFEYIQEYLVELRKRINEYDQ